MWNSFGTRSSVRGDYTLKKFLVLLISLFIVAPASAHTSLVSSLPDSGAVLNEVPAEVRLKFNESLLLVDDKNPNRIEVVNGVGQVISGMTVVEGPEIYTALDLSFEPSGEYLVKYRVVSADGHPVEGEYQFTVASPEVISAPVEAGGDERGIVRIIWVLLALSGVGILALLRLGK
ncbi:MAG: copper resistance protein CopC [Candidatus Nanopelagicaceae bacterium]|nr:copper resistance protein CopC [Candidatus Nanopelagicaceae bacterium]